DLQALGFNARPAAMGRPGHNPGRMPRIVSYNIQTAVEPDYHLIVAHEVTMLGFDRNALAMMSVTARDVMATDQLTAIADKGYCKSEEAGISVVVPKP
ncbi:MAG: hypothetical protein WBC95_11435, partial [Albidovulum sp.]